MRAFEQGRYVQSSRIIDASERITHGDYVCPMFVENLRGNGADVPKSLNGHFGAFESNLQLTRGFTRYDYNSAPCCLDTSFRTADGHRFARNDRRNGMAAVHGVRVHYPGHHLRI